MLLYSIICKNSWDGQIYPKYSFFKYKNTNPKKAKQLEWWIPPDMPLGWWFPPGSSVAFLGGNHTCNVKHGCHPGALGATQPYTFHCAGLKPYCHVLVMVPTRGPFGTNHIVVGGNHPQKDGCDSERWLFPPDPCSQPATVCTTLK